MTFLLANVTFLIGKSQFYSSAMSCVEDIRGSCAALPDGGVIVVSEPLDQLSDKWVEVPENSFMVVERGRVQIESLQGM